MLIVVSRKSLKATTIRKCSLVKVLKLLADVEHIGKEPYKYQDVCIYIKAILRVSFKVLDKTNLYVWIIIFEFEEDSLKWHARWRFV